VSASHPSSSLTHEQHDEPIPAPGEHPPSSVEPPQAEPPQQEVSTVIQRVLRALAGDIDASRIEAHRDAVQREVALTHPAR
jgi:hypothetical protein